MNPNLSLARHFSTPQMAFYYVLTILSQIISTTINIRFSVIQVPCCLSAAAELLAFTLLQSVVHLFSESFSVLTKVD